MRRFILWNRLNFGSSLETLSPSTVSICHKGMWSPRKARSPPSGRTCVRAPASRLASHISPYVSSLGSLCWVFCVSRPTGASKVPESTWCQLSHLETSAQFTHVSWVPESSCKHMFPLGYSLGISNSTCWGPNSSFSVLHILVCACVCVSMCAHVRVLALCERCGGRRLTSTVSFTHALLYLLKYNLSLNLKLTGLASQASVKPQEFNLCFLWAGITGNLVAMCGCCWS